MKFVISRLSVKAAGAFIIILFAASVFAFVDCSKTYCQPPVAAQQPDATADAQIKLDRFWANAKIEVDKSVMELLAQHQVELQRGLKYHKLMRGDSAKSRIALTFDDGPHPDYTPELLNILKKNNVKATFFLVGEMAEGHNVGNHTYHHVNLTKIPIEDVAMEIKACGDVLKQITGDTPHLFRPPGGDYDKSVIEAAEAEGYTTVLWTDDPGDYADPGKKVIEARLLRNISDGGIILIHDGIQETVDVLPQVIEYLKNRGFEFVTIDELMGKK